MRVYGNHVAAADRGCSCARRASSCNEPRGHLHIVRKLEEGNINYLLDHCYRIF